MSKRLLAAVEGGYECYCDSCGYVSRVSFSRMQLSDFVGWLEECEREHSSEHPECHWGDS